MKEATAIQQQFLWGLLLVVLASVIGVAIWRWQGVRPTREVSGERPLEGLGVFGKVPDFSLAERNSRQVERADFLGKVWVANFIYTHCPDTCPIQSAQMKELQTEFTSEKDLWLVSITVDPRRDSPEVLSEYADRFGADPERWFFLTGEEEAIYHLAQKGFHLGAAEIPHEKRDASGATHTHSPRFVLVDRKAQIRGYYPGTDREGMVRLRRDLRTLLLGER